MFSLWDFKMFGCLGEGRYGSVYNAYEKTTKTKVAIKKLSIEKLFEDSFLQVKTEIEIQSRIIHPNIVRLYAYFFDENYLYIVLEHALGVNLRVFLKSKISLNEYDTRSIIKQLVSAVKKLRELNIIHRDIKLENIIYYKGKIKLCDFGCSCLHLFQRRKSFCGTAYYLSPELASEKPDYSFGVDVWAIGVVMYELLFGKPPFIGNTQEEIIKSIKNDPLPIPPNKILSTEAQDLLNRMIEKDEEKRINIFDSFNHLWLQNI